MEMNTPTFKSCYENDLKHLWEARQTLQAGELLYWEEGNHKISAKEIIFRSFRSATCPDRIDKDEAWLFQKNDGSGGLCVKNKEHTLQSYPFRLTIFTPFKIAVDKDGFFYAIEFRESSPQNVPKNSQEEKINPILRFECKICNSKEFVLLEYPDLVACKKCHQLYMEINGIGRKHITAVQYSQVINARRLGGMNGELQLFWRLCPDWLKDQCSKNEIQQFQCDQCEKLKLKEER